MKLVNGRAKKVGASPGSLVHVGERKLEDTRFTLTRYAPDALSETEVDLVAACASQTRAGSSGSTSRDCMTWMRSEGLRMADHTPGRIVASAPVSFPPPHP